MGDAIRRALVDELERAFVEFSRFVLEIPADLYDAPVPGEEGSIRRILGHVVACGYGHVDGVTRAAERKPPPRRFEDPDGLDDPEAFAAACLDVGRYARESLDGVDDRFLERRFRTSWGQDYDGEQMLEHATCHPARHARQIRRFLDGELG
jgi:hypothetical protein